MRQCLADVGMDADEVFLCGLFPTWTSASRASQVITRRARLQHAVMQFLQGCPGTNSVVAVSGNLEFGMGAEFAATIC
jgi:hypothetical protein